MKMMLEQFHTPNYNQSQDQGLVPEVLSSVQVLLGQSSIEQSEFIERRELLLIQNELKKFKIQSEEIYNKYFKNLSTGDINSDNGGAICTIADVEIEKKFKEFVKQSNVLSEYTVVGEETGITEGSTNHKHIFIDPLDCTHLFKDGKPGSGSIIGVYQGNKNVAGMTLDISNQLEYHHIGDEYEILHEGKIIKSKKINSFKERLKQKYAYSEDKNNEWIKRGQKNRELYVYNSCKGGSWEQGDKEKMLGAFNTEYPNLGIIERHHRSVTGLDSALGLNQGFIHYGTSAHDFSHMVGFTQAAGGVMIDHNGNIITGIDVTQVERNYEKGSKLKEEAKQLQRESKDENRDEEERNESLRKSQEKELKYRQYIYTFPIIVAKDYETAKEYADLLKKNFGEKLDNMQNEALPRERQKKAEIDKLSKAIKEGLYS